MSGLSSAEDPGEMAAAAPEDLPAPDATAASPAGSSANAERAVEKTFAPPLGEIYRVAGIFFDDSDPALSAVVLIPRQVSGRQKLYWIGDAVGGGMAKVTHIESDRAHFLYRGKSVVLELEISRSGGGDAGAAGGPAAPSAGGALFGSAPAAEDDPAQPLIRSINRLKNVMDKKLGKMEAEGRSGYRVSQVEPNSILAKMGLQEDDILVQFNGAAVRESIGVADLMKAVTLTQGKITLGVRRGDKDITLDVDKSKVFRKPLGKEEKSHPP